MLRIRGTRDTLLTALVAEWSARQLALPAEPDGIERLQQLIGHRGKRHPSHGLGDCHSRIVLEQVHSA